MGKASSSKKVQRAARAGASTSSGEQRDLGFPMALALVIVLGISLVVWARVSRDATAAPRANDDHWHAVYDFYVCDGFVDKTILDQTDPDGIHTHGDNLFHIHPFNSEAAGENANLSAFFRSFGGEINDEHVVLDTGEELLEGADCNGEPTVLQVARFDADIDLDPDVFTDDLDKVRFLKTRQAFTIALVPEGTDIPKPRADRLNQLDAVDPNFLDLLSSTIATEDSAGAGDTPSTTVAADEATSTTVAPDDTTTE
jgi:hypothetical protein